MFLMRKKKLVINEPDPEYNVVYLGNVLTAMAKGEGCADKPLSLIWKTYLSRTRPELAMKMSVTRSGLKALTKQQGLTEYWSHRITFCAAPPQYPRVFCWIYKHEGKKMRPELRCHAVLCKKAEHPAAIAVLLHEKILAALKDYKREKVSRQNTRLAGVVSGYPVLPLRKAILSTGGQFFRPPVARSKSAPKLHSIEEGREEDHEQQQEEEDDEEEEGTEDREASTGTAEDVEEAFVPGTPRELEFSGEGSGGVFAVDLEIGNDIDKLKLDQRVCRCLHQQQRLSSTDTEPDSVSDESGYHEEKSSVEEEDDDEDEDDSLRDSRQVTAL